MKRRSLFALGILLCAVACRPAGDSTGRNDRTTSKRFAPVIVSAAASTKEVVEQLAGRFEQQTGATVHVNLGSSNALAAQITSGAPADLFLSASPEWAAAVADAGLALKQEPLMMNTLVIVTPLGNPARVQRPQDLTQDAVGHVALAGDTVPAGKYADQALGKMGLLEPLVTNRKIARGQDVRGTLSYVERGEAEAGIVYATDARASGKVNLVYTFDAQAHDPIQYILVTLKRAQGNSHAIQFGEFLKSDAAQATFESFGFRTGSESLRDFRTR